MSIRSLTDLAVRRDATARGEPVKSKDRTRRSERTEDALISTIPAEILAVYTALTGGTLAVLVQQEPTAFLPYRWGLLAFVLVLTPLTVAGSYRRKWRIAAATAPAPMTSRAPWAEMTAATIAAAAWFLAMPGSPLLAQLDGRIGELTAITITVCAPALLGTVFGHQLRLGTQPPPNASNPPAPATAQPREQVHALPAPMTSASATRELIPVTAAVDRRSPLFEAGTEQLGDTNGRR